MSLRYGSWYQNFVAQFMFYNSKRNAVIVLRLIIQGQWYIYIEVSLQQWKLSLHSIWSGSCKVSQLQLRTVFYISSYVSLHVIITIAAGLQHRVEVILWLFCKFLGQCRRINGNKPEGKNVIIAFWLAITRLAKWLWLCCFGFPGKS